MPQPICELAGSIRYTIFLLDLSKSFSGILEGKASSVVTSFTPESRIKDIPTEFQSCRLIRLMSVKHELC